MLSILNNLSAATIQAGIKEDNTREAILTHPQFLIWLQMLLASLECTPTKSDIQELGNWGSLMLAVGLNHKPSN